MTYELLYAGFDTLDVAFAGALRPTDLKALEVARHEAQDRQEAVLAVIGSGRVEMHVSGHGMRGGYAFIADTGPLGAKWMFKNNADVNQWNIFASPHATASIAYGYEGTRDMLWQALDDMGAIITDHSINRADFAIDFETRNFELQLDRFVAHSHTKVTPNWGKHEGATDNNQPSAVMRGRRLESVTVGKQPGRQIIVYDKRREVIEKQKPFWFEVWGKNRYSPDLEVWRVEIRAGKNELKEKYQLRTFEDFESGIGDVITNALEGIRYLAVAQSDGNVSRQVLHPLWIEAQGIVSENLCKLRSGLTADQVLNTTRERAINQYLDLCIGNAIGLGVAMGMTNQEIRERLPAEIAAQMHAKFNRDISRLEKSAQRTRDRLHFTKSASETNPNQR